MGLTHDVQYSAPEIPARFLISREKRDQTANPLLERVSRAGPRSRGLRAPFLLDSRRVTPEAPRSVAFRGLRYE